MTKIQGIRKRHSWQRPTHYNPLCKRFMGGKRAQTEPVKWGTALHASPHLDSISDAGIGQRAPPGFFQKPVWISSFPLSRHDQFSQHIFPAFTRFYLVLQRACQINYLVQFLYRPWNKSTSGRISFALPAKSRRKALPTARNHAAWLTLKKHVQRRVLRASPCRS